MALQNQRLTFLTDDQKITLLRDWDESGRNVDQITRRWGIGSSTFYKIKKEFLDIYQKRKKESPEVRNALMPCDIKFDVSRRNVIVQEKTIEAMEKLLTIANEKLNREIQRQAGDESIKEIVTMKELVDFFRAMSPYVLSPVIPEGEGQDGRSMFKKREFILNLIQNQQINSK